MKLKTLSAISHQGPFLQINEDGYEFDIENSMYLLLDGFGGAGLGDKTVSHLKKVIKSNFTSIAKDLDSTLPFFYGPSFLLEANALINSIIFAHKELYEANIKKSYSERSGASLMAIAQSESILSFVSTGNCRAYLIRNSSIDRVVLENSFNFLSTEKLDNTIKTLPMSGVGLYPDLQYQVRELRVQEDDKVILMTDGLYAHLKDNEILHGLNNLNLSGKERINKLVALVNDRGNLDNQSCLLLEF